MLSTKQLIIDNLRNRAYPVNSFVAIHGHQGTFVEALSVLNSMVDDGIVYKSFITKDRLPVYALEIDYHKFA